MIKKCQTVKIVDATVPFDPEQIRKIQEHPCFSENACHLFGRMHLPVAPRCNIQCNYCVREFDCVNESRPGVTSSVLTPTEALARTEEAIGRFHYIKVVAVAGPGEPLFNEETFETLRLVGERHPHMILCISTNGLLLPERVGLLEDLHLSNITVTINAVDPGIGAKIYSYVDHRGKRHTGVEGARILLERQLEGIRMAVERKMTVKVNTVLIPGVNDRHIVEVAKMARSLGVYMQNIIPLIPQHEFANVRVPAPEEKRQAQEECGAHLRQMRHCRRCRADAVGMLGKDVQSCLKS